MQQVPTSFPASPFYLILSQQVSVYQDWTDQFAYYLVNHNMKAVFVVPCLSGSDERVSWYAEVPL